MTDLLLCYDFPPKGGGIARMMAEVAARYPGGLIVSTGMVPGARDDGAGARVDRIDVPADRLRTVTGLGRWSRRAAALARSERAGFVWCGNLRPAGYVSWWLDRVHGVPYGVILYGGDLLHLRRKFRRSAFKRSVARRLLGRARFLVAISDWTAALAREVLAELGLKERDRLRVVPPGSDPARFRPDGAVDELGARYRLGTDRRRMLTVARLVPHKGIDVGIEALGRLQDRFPDLDYLVIGDGPDRARLEGLAAAAGVGHRVLFRAGVPDRDLPGLYRLADLYLGLSREDDDEAEGFGIALADASASGVAVVAGRSGGTAAAVKDGETGLRVAPSDGAEVAGAIDALLGDPARRLALGAAGRRWVATELNWDRTAAALAELSRSAARPVRP